MVRARNLGLQLSEPSSWPPSPSTFTQGLAEAGKHERSVAFVLTPTVGCRNSQLAGSGSFPSLTHVVGRSSGSSASINAVLSMLCNSAGESCKGFSPEAGAIRSRAAWWRRAVRARRTVSTPSHLRRALRRRRGSPAIDARKGPSLAAKGLLAEPLHELDARHDQDSASVGMQVEPASAAERIVAPSGQRNQTRKGKPGNKPDISSESNVSCIAGGGVEA